MREGGREKICVSSHQASRWGHCSAMCLHNNSEISFPWAAPWVWTCLCVTSHFHLCGCKHTKHWKTGFSKLTLLFLLTLSQYLWTNLRFWLLALYFRGRRASVNCNKHRQIGRIMEKFEKKRKREKERTQKRSSASAFPCETGPKLDHGVSMIKYSQTLLWEALIQRRTHVCVWRIAVLFMEQTSGRFGPTTCRWDTLGGGWNTQRNVLSLLCSQPHYSRSTSLYILPDMSLLMYCMFQSSENTFVSPIILYREHQKSHKEKFDPSHTHSASLFILTLHNVISSAVRQCLVFCSQTQILLSAAEGTLENESQMWWCQRVSLTQVYKAAVREQGQGRWEIWTQPTDQTADATWRSVISVQTSARDHGWRWGYCYKHTLVNPSFY